MGEPRILQRQEYADLDLDSRLEMIRSLAVCVNKTETVPPLKLVYMIG